MFLRLLLLTLVTCLLAACSEPPKFNGTDISGVDWGRDFSLKDHQGQVRHLGDFKGKTVVLFFGYTQCPDVCPTTLTTAAAALKRLGAEANKVQVLFVTLDPVRDTPDMLGKYVAAFNPDFLALHGTEADVAASAKEFKIFFQKQAGSTPTSYTIDHSAASYAFDPAGRLRLFIKHGTPPEQLANDLKQLIDGK